MINSLFPKKREIAYSLVMPRGRDFRAEEGEQGRKIDAWWRDCVTSEGKLNTKVLTNKEREQNTQINQRWERICNEE